MLLREAEAADRQADWWLEAVERPRMARVIEAGYSQLMLDQVAALRAYAHGHGRSWKNRLWMEWVDATAEPLLHQLRNTHGPA